MDLPLPERRAWLDTLARRDTDVAAEVAHLLHHACDDEALAMPTDFERRLARALDDGQEAFAGQRLGAWRLERKIGEGGMGEVWLARRADGLYAMQVAIKVLRSELSRTAHSARFARERAALARLNHPGIARLIDAGNVDGLTYLVLEFVDGRSLTDHVAGSCPTVAGRVRLLIDVARAVEHAHGLLIVHRDLKPGNVLVTTDGSTKLLDFGIAGLLDDNPESDALTRHAGRFVTLGYAAPEQITGAPIGVAADIYTLGVILFEMLSGTRPFGVQSVTRAAAEHATLHQQPMPLASVGRDTPGQATDFDRVRGDLEAIVAKTLRKDPAQRYASVAALVTDLEHWLEFRPVTARREDRLHRLRLALHRHGLTFALVALIVVALTGGLVATSYQWRRAEAAARESEQVTGSLARMLGSVNPDQHAGQWPTALQLLDEGRIDLQNATDRSPGATLRLLNVMTRTYLALNRPDLAIPLAERWIALSAQTFGDDDRRTVDGRVMLAQIHTPIGPWERIITLLEPERGRVASIFGPRSDRMRDVLHCLFIAYTRTGNSQLAQSLLDEAGAITNSRFAPEDFERVYHHNYEALLYASEGRIGDALEALRLTEPYQADPPPEFRRFALVLRRGVIEMQIRLGQYDHIEERIAAIDRDANQLLGPGNALSTNLGSYLWTYHTDRGEYDKALRDWSRIVDTGTVGLPRSMHPLVAARLLLARALAHDGDAATLLREARVRLKELRASVPTLESLSGPALLDVASTALLLDEPALANEAIRTIHESPAIDEGRNIWFASRVAQIEGEAARASGDLERSRVLLQQRVDQLMRGKDRGTPTIWAASMDLAYTLASMRDPRAAEQLAFTSKQRPAQLPADHPADRLGAHVAALIAGDEAAIGATRVELDRALGNVGEAPSSLRGMRRTWGGFL